MNNLKTQVFLFKDPALNDLATNLINRNQSAQQHYDNAKQELQLAIVERWRNGKDVYEHYDKIIDEMGSQRAFAEEIGMTESMLSNDLRAYKALLQEGCESEGDFLDILNQKGLKGTTYVWERLPKLLNDPTQSSKTEQQPKDEKRLQEIFEEVEEIRQRNEANTEINEEAEYIERHIQHVAEHLMSENPANLEWESEHFLEFVRGYGKNVLTGESVPDGARLQPHHVNPFTGQAGGGVGNKVPDCWTVPVDSETHRLAHSSDSPFSIDEFKDAIITVMTRYLILYGK